MPQKTQKNTATTISNTVMIPFNQLVADPNNVRKTRSQESIASLAENILAEGLLQNLVVRALDDGTFAVAGGERRRQAMEMLVSAQHMNATDDIPCKLVDHNATSASLSENIHREAMHPADQFEAWVKMAEEGLSISDIAQRHGATVTLVEQRLTLGRLSPNILEALREGHIDVEVARAFTITDDWIQQESVYNALKSHWGGIRAYAVKSALTKDEVPHTDKLAVFVGAEAYETEGGEIRTDLFGETTYFKDADLLAELATEKLETEADRLQQEGWAWIEIAFDEDYRAGVLGSLPPYIAIPSRTPVNYGL